AQAAPSLPAKTPAQLLAALASKPQTPPLTGTVVETSSLGLPSLPGTSDPTSIASLLTGSHTIRVWYSDPQHFRVSVPQSMTETDIIRNGSSAWLWDSTHNTVTHATIPAHSAGQDGGTKNAQATPSQPPLTPQQAAQQGPGGQQRDRGWRGRLSAGAGPQEQQFADRPDPDRRRRQPGRPAPGT